MVGALAGLALVGWFLCAALLVVVVRLRGRLELVARAEHELRGPLTAFSLALDAARGTPAGRRLRIVLDSELARARAGLADLAAARTGVRAEPVVERVGVDRLLRSSAAAWEPAARARGRRVLVRSDAGLAVVSGDRSRLAQALGNVMSNAVEHGSGDVTAVATRSADRVRIEVTNATATAAGEAPSSGAGELDGGPGGAASRGRGLEIAADAAADAGGSLSSAIGARRARTVIDLPIEP
jgi:signal transduction histidine kinase